MNTATLKMSDEQFDRLRKVVYDRSGIWFADGKQYVLESRLSRRLEELDMTDFDQYLMYLTIGPYQTNEFQEMFDRITINETSFFRNAPQLDIFERRVLPQLLEARKASKTLRLWSCACSSGEEPYTLAMQVHRTLGIRLADWRIEILGTDISEKVLLQAQQGVYGSYPLQNVEPLVLTRYFKKTPTGHEVDPTIRSMVTFEKMNMKDTIAAKRYGTWDVIFCRNVMIYFDQQMRQRCIELFHQQLADDGTLFIGHSETIRNPDRFTARSEPESFAYRPVK